MKNKRKNIINKVIVDASKDKTFVGLIVRLKSNGRFQKINGQVHSVKINQNGEAYAIVENFFGQPRQDGRKWQSVNLNQILSVRKDRLVYRSAPSDV